MKLKKAIGIILCAAVLSNLFAACGKKEQTSAEDTSKTTSDVPQYMNATGYPITKEKITIKAFGQRSSQQGEWKDMDVIKKLEEITNIHMEFETPETTSYNEKKNLLLASGDYPDIFIGTALSVQDEETYGPQGVFIPLENLINKYNPTLKALMDKDPQIKSAITSADKHIYALPYLVNTKTIGSGILYINMKWLERVGMQKPTNVDELYNVLKAFKEKDANGNGKADELPMSSEKFAMIEYTILNAFSGTAGGHEFDLKDGKVVYNAIQPYFKDYLAYLRKLYNEKLLDNEMFVQTKQQFYAKGKDGRLGVLTATPGVLLDVKKYDPHEFLPPLTSSINNKKVTTELKTITTSTFAITNKCKYPEAVMRWTDILYKDDNSAVDGISGTSMFIGEYKKHWDYTDATKKRYKNIVPDSSMTALEYIHKKVTPGNAVKFPSNVNFPAIAEGDPFLELKAVESEKHYFPYMVPIYPYTVRYTKEETERMAFLQTDVTTYVTQMTAKFVSGDESLDKWDSYISNLKKMNIDELIKIKQAAYDRWKNVK